MIFKFKCDSKRVLTKKAHIVALCCCQQLKVGKLRHRFISKMFEAGFA